MVEGYNLVLLIFEHKYREFVRVNFVFFFINSGNILIRILYIRESYDNITSYILPILLILPKLIISYYI